MGVAAALGTAAAFAVAATLVGSQSKRIDALSMGGLRAVAGSLFLLAALFVLSASDDVGRMSAGKLLQFNGAILVGLGIGDPLYVVAILLLGMTRALTTVLGLYALSAYVLAVVFLGESVSLQIALGSVAVLAGVYLVVVHGRKQGPGVGPDRYGPTKRGRLRRRRAEPVLIVGGSGQLAPTAVLTPPQSAAGWTAIRGGGVAVAATIRLPIVQWLVPRVAVGLLVASLAGLAWAIDSVWTRGTSEGFNATAVMAVRMPAAAIALLLLASLRRNSAVRRRSLTRRGVAVIIGSGFLAMGIGAILLVYSLQTIGPGPAAVLVSTSPLMALPLGVIFLGERLTIWVAVGIPIAVGGVALISL